MNNNMQAVWANRVLNAVMWLCGLIASTSLAKQLPPWAEPYVPLVNIVGIICAKLAKTPSQAIAAAVPPTK